MAARWWRKSPYTAQPANILQLHGLSTRVPHAQLSSARLLLDALQNAQVVMGTTLG
ncbi:Hypothetical protein, putative [Bodo saltans]|uniref:Uncharacterized protein n=1 Tax=Bodo saltans TaxID=75058 RepID=A0A0S4JMA0_BODSA|nr:Hypothetical protein, putative [Bodo saltans]|eukprot:CUG92645.1 Hypothetical protein, putative [Bodo saltans]